MTSPETTAGALALARAVEADDRIWSQHTGSAQHRLARNLAVVEAQQAGMALEMIADKLGVRIADVERMATRSTASAST